MPEVRCTVSNCAYWDLGNRCVAERILITAGMPREPGWAAQDPAAVAHTPVQLAEDTFCLTFSPRQEEQEEQEEPPHGTELVDEGAPGAGRAESEDEAPVSRLP